MPGVNRRWMVYQQPTGAPEEGKDIKMVQEPIPELADGYLLVRNLVMSLDPYMRGTMNKVAYGRRLKYPRQMTAATVAEVVASKDPKFPVGTLVCGDIGWCDYKLVKPKHVHTIIPGSKPSHALGVLGMPGATAYYGLFKVCKPEVGNTVCVSSCTGAVGQLVGQLAKLHGCKVIGFTSTAEKCEFARSIGYDAAIIYRGKTISQLIKEVRAVAPQGIDCYFDNAGGNCTEATMACLNQFARVAVCGQIAYYNLKNPLSARAYPHTMIALTKCATIQGFLVQQFGSWEPAHKALNSLIQDGKLKVREDETVGLENAFTAFQGMFHDIGKGSPNFGKKIVRIAEATHALRSSL